jgi:hypothetical protein
VSTSAREGGPLSGWAAGVLPLSGSQATVDEVMFEQLGRRQAPSAVE